MKRGAIFLIMTLILLVVQGVLFGATSFRTDLGALMVVFLALERAVIPGAGWALAVGYLNDVFAGTSRGLYASAYVLVFFAIRLLVAQLAGGRAIFVTAVGVLATALSLACVLVLQRILGPSANTFTGISPALPSLLLGAAVLSYPSYRLLKLVDERFTEPEDDLVFRR